MSTAATTARALGPQALEAIRRATESMKDIERAVKRLKSASQGATRKVVSLKEIYDARR